MPGFFAPKLIKTKLDKCDKMGHVDSMLAEKNSPITWLGYGNRAKMNDRFRLVGHIPLFQGVNYVLKTYCSLYSPQNMCKTCVIKG